MDLTILLLILIGVLVITVIYLQLRLAFIQPPIVVTTPPVSAGSNAGCAVATLVILAIVIGILLTVFFGPLFTG